MTLLCDHKLYTSPSARRCTNSCYDTLGGCPRERTQLSTKQTAELIYDLTTEQSRVKSTPFLADNSIPIFRMITLAGQAGQSNSLNT